MSNIFISPARPCPWVSFRPYIKNTTIYFYVWYSLGYYSSQFYTMSAGGPD